MIPAPRCAGNIRSFCLQSFVVKLFEQRVERLPVSIRLSQALARMWAEATQTPLQLVPLILSSEWSAKHKSQRAIGGNAQDMLDIFLSYIAKIAAEYERQALNP